MLDKGGNDLQQGVLHGGVQDRAGDGDHGEVGQVHGVGVQGSRLPSISCGSKKRQHRGSFIFETNTITRTNNVDKLIMKYEGWRSGTSDLLEDQDHPGRFKFGKELPGDVTESPLKKRRLENAQLTAVHPWGPHHRDPSPSSPQTGSRAEAQGAGRRPSSSPTLPGSSAQAPGAGRRPSACRPPSSSGMSRRALKGSPRQSISRRWTASTPSKGGTRPGRPSLASGSARSRATQQVALNGEETCLPPPVPPPPGAHPPPTVWKLPPPSSSWQGEGVPPDGLQTLLLQDPHPTPGSSEKRENRVNTSNENEESLKNQVKKKSTAEKKKNEDRSRKRSQEAAGNVRKMLEKLEARREKENPYLRVPGPEAGHVPVPRGGSGTGVSSSSSSSGRGTGTSSSSIGKFRGGKGALGIGGEFPANGTLYGRVACQTGAAHICAAAVPPSSNLEIKGGVEDDKPGIGPKSADGERGEIPGEYRNIPGLGEDQTGATNA